MNNRILSILVTLVLLWSTFGTTLINGYRIVEIPRKSDLHKMNLPKRPALDIYLTERDDLMTSQTNRGLGFDVLLSNKEALVNEILMNLKLAEINKGINHPYGFAPSRHFFDVLEEINGSDLFKILKKMPKGGVLHAHDTALCSTDYVISLTYRENLWQCNNTVTGLTRFMFSRNQPITAPFVDDNECTWELVAEVRNRVGASVYDAKMKAMFSLYTTDPTNDYKDINTMWQRFMNIFITFDGIVTYEPVWREYYKQALKEFYEDGVQYLELRSTLPHLYDLDGNIYTEEKVVKAYAEVMDEYKGENPDFIGGKVIYAPGRFADEEQFAAIMEATIQLKELYPEFVAGFDLVGQEDVGRPLIDFAEQLLQLPESIKFFFHAGETNWNGKTDDNLIDAILLGTKRIGHGYALVKHPSILERVKQQGIAVEVNPVSNQVLRLVDDYRNHPAAVLLADDYPVVISSDDPSFWEAAPLSHDFYQAFLGLASSRQDLRFLKKLAMNSLQYSTMTDMEKTRAAKLWTQKWDDFIDEILQLYGNFV